MKVYIVSEITKAVRRPMIIGIFDSPEEAVKCCDYWAKGLHKDDPYEIKIDEHDVKSEFNK